MKRLKTPELGIPQFLIDLFDDLRDRRLLPLVALVLVAIVAAPFLLSDSGEDAGNPPPLSSSPTASGSQGRSVLTVVKAAPGLRDYRKRLKHLPAKDPFQAAGSSAKAAGGGAGGGAAATPATFTSTTSGSPATATSTTSTSTTSTPEPSAPAPAHSPSPQPATGHPGGHSVEPSDGHALLYFSYEVDVRIAHNGKTRDRKGVPMLSQLPSKKVAAVMFMGVTGNGKKALLLVSDDVDSVFGDGKCVLGSERCDLIAVEPGFPQTFVLPGKHNSYRINILRIKRAFSKTPPHLRGRAPRQRASTPRLALSQRRFSK